jgi:cobalamin-dependent methionine synthase I
MMIVGELINASRKSVREIIEKQDAEGIVKLARDQRYNGANFIDVCATSLIMIAFLPKIG